VACAVGPSVTTASTDFSFPNLIFWGIYLNFQSKNHLKINISQIVNLIIFIPKLIN
jgi:hypothetical protein